MKELTFNDWWDNKEQHKDRNQSFKEEALKGWEDASVVHELSLIRGIGAYCEGWNAKIRERKSV